MTRKDYIIIARVIKDINERKATGERIAELFSDELKKENQKFNKDIFFEACGITTGKKD